MLWRSVCGGPVHSGDLGDSLNRAWCITLLEYSLRRLGFGDLLALLARRVRVECDVLLYKET